MIYFTIALNNRARICEQILALDERLWQCTIVEHKSKRSIPQNKWVRKFAREFGKHIGYDEDDAYDLLMYKCNPVFKIDPITGEEIRLAGHFSKLDTKKAAEVQELIIRFCIELGFYWEG
jgi:hypothetical protein